MKKVPFLLLIFVPFIGIAQTENNSEDQLIVDRIIDPKQIKSVSDFKEFILMPGEYEVQQLDLIVKLPNSAQLYTTTLWTDMDELLQERSLKHLWEAVPDSRIWLDNVKLVLANGTKRTASVSLKVEEDGMIYIYSGIAD